jgi:hypothetical protein
VIGFDVDGKTSKGKPGMMAASLKSYQNQNANDTAGKALGFGDVLFTQNEIEAPTSVPFRVEQVAVPEVMFA